jgi:HSP20 family protein
LKVAMSMRKDIEPRSTERSLGRLWDWIDGPDFTRWFEGFRPMPAWEDRLRVEKELKDDALVIRAEVPGIDPEKDAEITVEGGRLHLRVERRRETTEEHEGRFRSEFRYGSLHRTLALPESVDADDVTATYEDGLLEIRVPMATTKAPSQKIPISKA